MSLRSTAAGSLEVKVWQVAFSHIFSRQCSVYSVVDDSADLRALQLACSLHPVPQCPSISICRIPIRDEVFIAAIQRLDIRLGNLEASNICIRLDPLFIDRLWKRHVSFLQRPPHKQLRRCAFVLLAQFHNLRIFETQGASERGISFDYNVVLGRRM